MAELFSLSQEKEVFSACRVLFGAQVMLNSDFLAYLQLDGVRSAYRLQAKTTHPDRFPGASLLFLQRQAELFRRVTAAYEILNNFLSVRERGLWSPKRSRTVMSGRRSASGGDVDEKVERRRVRREPRPFSRKIYTAPSVFDLPQRPLPFGLYLNYRGLISHADLARALVWQRRQRPRMGDLSQSWGRLNEAEVKVILQTRRQGVSRFGEKAVALGFLNQFQVDTMIHFQRSKQRLLGEFFVEEGKFSHSLIEKLVSQLHDHNEQVILDTPLLHRFLGIFF
ncbi:MAG: J domain-containing protein [Deltaproteobacteria bacterium]|nr:J domain-containing protein [Candidatus Tharpella aukensis]